MNTKDITDVIVRATASLESLCACDAHLSHIDPGEYGRLAKRSQLGRTVAKRAIKLSCEALSSRGDKRQRAAKQAYGESQLARTVAMSMFDAYLKAKHETEDAVG